VASGGFGIRRVARSRKAGGLFRRAPDAHEVGERLGRIAKRMIRGAVTRAKWKGDRYIVDLALNETAPRARLSVEADASLMLAAVTSPVGPGYHVELLARVEPVLAEIDYVWEDDDDDIVTIQRDACEWLADELRAGKTVIDVPRPFIVPGAAVLTMLGPRDAAWRDAVIADPQRGADAFAYWQPGAPGHAARARALLAMWHDVPWREPLDDHEREILKRVDRDLRAARKADIDLDVPWPDWAELLDLLGTDDGYAEEAARRAAGRPGTIGYRRHELDVELAGGWWVRLGGAFVGGWDEAGGRYWATDGERTIELVSMTAEDHRDSTALLAVAPEHHPVVERIEAGSLHGRAEAYDEGDVHIVHGLVADAPHIGILTCKGTKADEPWALATWRSLRLRSEAP
jgi:hypothetical protein